MMDIEVFSALENHFIHAVSGRAREHLSIVMNWPTTTGLVNYVMEFHKENDSLRNTKESISMSPCLHGEATNIFGIDGRRIA